MDELKADEPLGDDQVSRLAMRVQEQVAKVSEIDPAMNCFVNEQAFVPSKYVDHRHETEIQVATDFTNPEKHLRRGEWRNSAMGKCVLQLGC